MPNWKLLTKEQLYLYAFVSKERLVALLPDSKVWGKKTSHFLRFVSPQISILALKASLKSQNKMFRQLIWGILRLCRSNMTRDMIKNWKVDFSKNVSFCIFDFLWLCHWSLCEVAEAKLMASVTSLGYQMNVKHHSFYMRCWLLM